MSPISIAGSSSLLCSIPSRWVAERSISGSAPSSWSSDELGAPGIDPVEQNQDDIDEMQERVVVPFGEQLWLHPRHFILAATLEYLALPDDLSANVVGRSSWGRLGLIVATAVFVHPGFRGCLTLELVNDGDSPIALAPGARIAQLTLQRLEQPAPPKDDEADKYTAPVRPQASHLASEREEFERLKRLGVKLRSRLG